MDLTTVVSMGRPSKSNVASEPLRWRAERAAVEFGLTTNTLRKALGKNSAAPDHDGLYSTQQIIAALYGSLHIEKLRTQRQIADRITLENQITRSEVLNRAELTRVMSAIGDAMSSRIMASGLSRSEKEDILRDLATVPLVLQEVADRQTRLPRNSKHHNGDVGEG
jgi:hypothetical protein